MRSISTVCSVATELANSLSVRSEPTLSRLVAISMAPSWCSVIIRTKSRSKSAPRVAASCRIASGVCMPRMLPWSCPWTSAGSPRVCEPAPHHAHLRPLAGADAVGERADVGVGGPVGGELRHRQSLRVVRDHHPHEPDVQRVVRGRAGVADLVGRRGWSPDSPGRPGAMTVRSVGTGLAEGDAGGAEVAGAEAGRAAARCGVAAGADTMNATSGSTSASCDDARVRARRLVMGNSLGSRSSRCYPLKKTLSCDTGHIDVLLRTVRCRPSSSPCEGPRR